MSESSNQSFSFEPVIAKGTVYINSQEENKATIIYPNHGITICTQSNQRERNIGERNLGSFRTS